MKLYNTLSRQKEDFPHPREDGEVRMYVCGVTPYAPSHVGHAMSYVVFDVLRRYLEFKGLRVRHVQNFTDVEDKLIRECQTLGVPVQELSERYIQDYFDVMDALNVKRADIYPKATEEIPTIVEMIEGLVDKGYAYASDGDVYFRVLKRQDYGKLSHRSLEGMMAGARVEVARSKEHPMDFTLWKGAKEDEPCWDSPWGKGRPGWHIECSAMSYRYLGQTIDLHGGGQDLIFPHHENEIAQSESFTDKSPFSRIWIHHGLLQLAEEKMSKSLGNIVPAKEALSQFSPDVLRLFFLSSHYRNPLAYSQELVGTQERAAERLRFALKETSDDGGGEELDSSPYRRAFLSGMDDDLNTPQAIAALFDLAREINRCREHGRPVRTAQADLKELASVLGLTLSEPSGSDSADAAPFIELLMEIRAELRQAKRYDLADKVRDRLAGLGIALEDTPRGSEWKRLRRQS